MLVRCPSCEASYRLDAAALGAGRSVRCARCREAWYVEGPPAPIASLDDAEAVDAYDATPLDDPTFETIDAELADVAAPRPEKRFGMSAKRTIGPRSRKGRDAAPPQPMTRPAEGPRRKLRPAAVFATCGLIVIGLALAERRPLVRAVPSLAGLYAAIGLPVNIRGLEISDVRSVEDVEEGVPILLVTGAVANVTNGVVEAPRLRLSVRSRDGRELYAWTTVAGRPKLAPGEAAPFRARLASPPAEGRAVDVRFLSPRDLASRPNG
jgi:predicted Zn finger-like uncharacterized protein